MIKSSTIKKRLRAAGFTIQDAMGDLWARLGNYNISIEHCGVGVDYDAGVLVLKLGGEEKYYKTSSITTENLEEAIWICTRYQNVVDSINKEIERHMEQLLVIVSKMGGFDAAEKDWFVDKEAIVGSPGLNNLRRVVLRKRREELLAVTSQAWRIKRSGQTPRVRVAKY